MIPGPYRHHGRQPSAAARRAYDDANARLEIEQGRPSGFYASAGRHVRSKVHLRALLRDAGLAKGAAERVAAAGWPALSPDDAAADSAAAIRAATEQMQRFK